jgi:hypothetical protein
VLTVDHDDKLVVIGSASGGEKGDFRTMLMNTGELLASMKDNGLRMQKVMKGNDTWLELSQLTDANIQLCNIQYDPITFLIKRIWMKVLDPSQNSTNPVIVDITYRYNMKAAGKDIFNEGRFVTIKGKSAALQDAYQRYSLINQL